MNNAALYIRVSTEEQKIHGLSIEAQTEALNTWAAENGFKIVDHYIDAGISARKKHSKRPELMRLLQDVSAGKIDIIVFTKLDRWFRNISEYYKVQEILEANNVNWKTVHEDYDTLTASGRLKINIMLSVAQDEADRTSERIKAVFDNKKKNKEPVSGNMPTGYIIKDKTIEFDPEWNESVKTLFLSYLTYASPAIACREVLQKTGKTISYRLCTLMLTNIAYCGRFNGIEGMCPQYITDEEFDRIQRLRKTHPKRPDTGRVYIFGGLLHCAECGHRLSGCCQHSKHKDGTTTELKYYNCQNHYIRSKCTNNACTMEKYIEEEAMRLIPLEWAQTKWKMGSDEAKEKSNLAELQKIKRKIERLKELYLNDLIEIAEYKKEYEALMERKEEMDTAKTQRESAENINKMLFSGWESAYYLLDDAGKHAFWCAVVDDITVSKNKEVKIMLKY